MSRAIIWSKNDCIYCIQAKNLLATQGIEFEEHKIGDGYTVEQLLEAVPAARTVPQIFIDEEYIGGYDALKKRLTAN